MHRSFRSIEKGAPREATCSELLRPTRALEACGVGGDSQGANYGKGNGCGRSGDGSRDAPYIGRGVVFERDGAHEGV